MDLRVGKIYPLGILITVVVFIVGLVLLISDQPTSVQAGSISNLTASLANTAKSTSTNTVTTTATISFTNQTAIPAAGGRIHLRFSGINGAGICCDAVTLAAGTSPSSLSLSSYSGNEVVFQTSADIVANSSITLKPVIKTPTVAGYYFFHVWTSVYGSTILDGEQEWGGKQTSDYIEIGSNTNFKIQVTIDNTPVPWANVQLVDSNGTTNYYGYGDKQGWVGFGEVPAGAYTRRIYTPPYSNSGVVYVPPADANVTIPAAGTVSTTAAYQNAPKTLTVNVKRDSTSGQAVTDAKVYITRAGGQGSASVNVSSAGAATFRLPGGGWWISTGPQNYQSVNWTTCNGNTPGGGSGGSSSPAIAFVEDSTSETKSYDSVVYSLNSTVTASIKKPDGSAVGQYSAGLQLNGAKGCWFSGSTDGSGKVSIQTTADTYTVSGWSSDNSFTFPTVANFSVAGGETKDLKTITLEEKKDRITGKVVSSSGEAISGVSVNAWKDNAGASGEWANTTTDSNGDYTLKVTPGDWRVSAWLSPTGGNPSDYVSNSEPQKVTVVSGVAKTLNFTFAKATNRLKITIAKPDGSLWTDGYAWVGASDGSTYTNINTSISGGTGELKLPKGIWTISLWISSGAASSGSNQYSPGDPVKVTFAGDNETQSTTLTTKLKNATIKGTIYDSGGDKIINTWVNVYASQVNKRGVWESTTTNTGEYSLSLAAGKYAVGYSLSSAAYSTNIGQTEEVEVAEGQTVTYNPQVKKNDSKISGTAKTPSGDPLRWAWISFDSHKREKTTADPYYFGGGISTDNSGNFEILVPAGTYYVKGYAWGYLSPKEEKLVVDSSHPASVTLVFRSSDRTITGSVKKNGAGVDGYISAWAEDGGFVDTNAKNNGQFTLDVYGGTIWHMTAFHKSGSEVFRSKETLLEVKDGNITQDIELIKQSYTLPSDESITFNATQTAQLKLDDGTTVTIPANAIATAGTVTVTAVPDTILATEQDARPVSYGYDFEATQNGTALTNFPGNVQVDVAYQESWVTDSKATESELEVKYYDTTRASWEPVTCTENTAANSLACQTNHFTKFAVVAAADTTPPSAPTNLVATAGHEKVTLSWVNPTQTDFLAVNIYRSTISGQVGAKIANSVAGASYENTGLTNGTTYYYIVRSVDQSGNESVNVNQVASQPSAQASSSSSSDSTAQSGTLPRVGYDATQAAREQRFSFWGLAILGLLMAGLELNFSPTRTR